MTISKLASNSVLVTLLCAAAPMAADDKKVVPADFKIIAQYQAGFSDWKPWRYTITSDGKVSKEITAPLAGKEEVKLSQDDLRALRAKIEEADFFALKQRYDYQVTDNPTLDLTVTLNGKTHKVSVYAPGHFANDKEVKRFFKLWSEVLKKVPSPNPKQTADQYKS